MLGGCGPDATKAMNWGVSEIHLLNAELGINFLWLMLQYKGRKIGLGATKSTGGEYGHQATRMDRRYRRPARGCEYVLGGLQHYETSADVLSPGFTRGNSLLPLLQQREDLDLIAVLIRTAMGAS